MRQHMLKISKSVLILAALGGIVWVSAGELNPPPGAVAPTMKTLTEVEPRIALNATNTPGDAASTFNIAQPGSYYLASNISGAIGKIGIKILSGHVTLDLNGFTLDGAGAPSGIVLNTVSDVVIKNGFISNWSASAIVGGNTTGLLIENVHIDNIAGVSVFVGPESIILNCSITNAFSGIQVGIRSRVQRCAVRRGATGTAISVSSGCLVSDCQLNDISGIGIQVFGVGSAVSRNVVNGCAIMGISVSSGASSGNRIESNHVIGGGVGLDIASAGNYVSDNTVKGNIDNYNFVAGNKLNLLLYEIPESIDWPASVVFAGSMTSAANTNGLTINADDVTVDLAGHALIGTNGTIESHGIAMFGRSNVEIRNGTIRNFDGNGISESIPSGTAHRIIGIRAMSNGAIGISLQGSGHTVQSCMAHGNGTIGIGVFGSAHRVIGNSAILNGAEGIFVGGNSLIDGNTAYSNDRTAVGFANIKSCTNCTFGLNHAP